MKKPSYLLRDIMASQDMALEARLMADRLRFGSQNTNGYAIWRKNELVAEYAEAARKAGDMITHHRLHDWIARQRRAPLTLQRQFIGSGQDTHLISRQPRSAVAGLRQPP